MTAEQKNIYKRLLDFFSSLKLAIVLLILLAAVSVLGTFIPQEQDPMLYLSRYGPEKYNYLKLAGLIDLYHSWGFRLLMSLVTVNLVVCTLRRFKGVYNRTLRPVTERQPDDIRRMRLSNELPSPGRLPVLEAALSDKGYSITKRGRFIYATKGRFGAWGDMITHFSIFLVIMGALAGSLGFVSTVNVYVNGSTSIAYNWTSGRDEPLGFTLFVENASQSFYSANMKISVRERETGRKVGVFDVRDGGLFRIPGTDIAISPDSVDTKRKETLLTIFRGGKPTGVYDTGRPSESLAAMGGFPYVFFLDSFDIPSLKSIASTIRLERNGVSLKRGIVSVNNPLRFEGLTIYQTAYDVTPEGRGYSGFQIVKDPGIPLVWAGFALILVGLCVSFFYFHRQVWVYASDDSIQMGGRTNKDWEGFMREYGGLVKRFMQEVEL